MMKLKSKVKFEAYCFFHYVYIVHITAGSLANYMLFNKSTVSQGMKYFKFVRILLTLYLKQFDEM
jgi:hypothetical protein